MNKNIVKKECYFSDLCVVAMCFWLFVSTTEASKELLYHNPINSCTKLLIYFLEKTYIHVLNFVCVLTNVDTQGKSALESKSKIKLCVSNLIFMLFLFFLIQARDPNK